MAHGLMSNTCEICMAEGSVAAAEAGRAQQCLLEVGASARDRPQWLFTQGQVGGDGGAEGATGAMGRRPAHARVADFHAVASGLVVDDVDHWVAAAVAALDDD